MPTPANVIEGLIRNIFAAEGLTAQEAEFAIRVARGESSLGQNIEPHSDSSTTGAPGTSQGIFQLRTPGLLDTFNRQFTDWRNPIQEITFVARYVKANRNDGRSGWNPWSVAHNLIAGGDNPIPAGPGGNARANLNPLLGLSTEEVLALLAANTTSPTTPLLAFTLPDGTQITGAGISFDTIFPQEDPFPGLGGQDDPFFQPLTPDRILDQQIQAWLNLQFELTHRQALIDAGLDDAARAAGFRIEEARRQFERDLILLAERNNLDVEAARVAFERQLEILGIQQVFQTDERVAAQEFSAEQAGLDRDLSVRLNRLSAETSLATTIAQLQESARQQAVSLIGVDPQRGAIAARGVQALGTSPSQKFQQGLRQFATQELPTPSTGTSELGDIETNISSLQDIAIGRPQPSLSLGAQGLPGAAGGARISGRGLTMGTGGTAVIVGEGHQGEGLRNNTAEVAIFHEDGSMEVVPLAGRAQGGFEFTPGITPTRPFEGLARTAGGGEAPGLVQPSPISPEDFQDVINDLPPPPPPRPPGLSPVVPDLAPGEIDPEVARFVADLFVNENPGKLDAFRAETLGLPVVARLINQFSAGLISLDELHAGIPDPLLPLGEKEFTTEAQALFPIFERLGIDFVPVGGRNEAGGLGVAAGEFRSGLPRPLLGESQDLFDRLGTQPRLIQEAETGAFFFRNSAGELRKIGDESELIAAGFNPQDAITQASSQIRGRVGDTQGIAPGEAATDIAQNPFASAPIFSPLDEEQNVGIFLPNPNQLAALWPSLSESERGVMISAFGLAGVNEADLARNISFHTPGGLARGSVGAPRRSGVLA